VNGERDDATPDDVRLYAATGGFNFGELRHELKATGVFGRPSIAGRLRGKRPGGLDRES
jgi:hypothetical protein